ncbi:Hypothetical predicted protein [Mytilus galloprovincialis]|uniref:Uncharacterized protein n=1 Tax=Mytilus galloprovincialis TaxID=29158 RepID=A0A8B6FQL2_MYTGA|nr:Hypothetical predicted protein [Mytilus galloprovincialis]
MLSISNKFDGTAPLGWFLLKADIDSTAFVKGWNSEQKLQTLVSRITGKALKFYENRSYPVQAEYETICKLFNDRFDSVGYPLLIMESLENVCPYPDELLDEFTDRIEELVEGAFQNESENVKEHLIIKYLTNACCDEEGKELIEKTGDHDQIVRRKETDENVGSGETTRTDINDEPEWYTPSKHLSEVEWNEAKKNKGADTNFKIIETEDHRSVILEKRTEQTAAAQTGETIEKTSNPLIEYYTTPCNSIVVKEDAVYTMESLSPKYETDWLGEDDNTKQTEKSLSPKYETDWLGEDDNTKQTEESLSPKYETDWLGDDDNRKQTEESLSPKDETDWLGEDDDIRQREESPSPNYKPDTISEDDGNGRKIPTNSYCFNEHIRDCDKKINPSKVNAGKPKETSRLITRHKLHLLVQSMVKENNNLDKKRSTSRQEYILEENINVNEDSQGILTYDQVRQTQTKHEKGENKDQKQFINRYSDQKQLSQSELELLSNTIDRLTPNSVYCKDNLLTLELKDKQHRYWMTSHGNMEIHYHDEREERERASNKEGKSLQDTQSNCVKRQIMKTEQGTQTDELSSGKESGLTKRKEVKDQSTQTTDDQQTPIHFNQIYKWSMHFTQTAINHRNRDKAEDEHIDPGFLEGTQLKGKIRTEKLQEAKRCTRAYDNNNIGRDSLKDTEKKAYVKTKTSKYKKIKKEQQIKKIKHKLITDKKESDTSKRNMMSTIKRKDEFVDMRVLPKTRSWDKDVKLRWKRPKAKRFHSKTLGRSDWNLNLDKSYVQTECLVTGTPFGIAATEDGDTVANH